MNKEKRVDNNRFVAIDVETANADYSSICQIGIVEFVDEKIIDKWETLINPNDYFDGMNISIHGITEKMVENSPTFSDVYEEIKKRIENKIVVHHMPFDKVAINRACDLHKLNLIETDWLDSAKIVRRVWNDFAHSGYGLSDITNFLGIEFKHHNALEDAIAAGKVLIKAMEKENYSINDIFDRAKRPINLYNGSSSIKIEGNPNGVLFGENLVFTGSLFISRAEAGKLAADLGCNVTNSVTKKTTILVVGTQDNYKLAGYNKSSKHRKAEKYIEKGANIRIITEDDFKYMINEIE